MLSRIKKSLVAGLSVVLSVSLNCGMCVCAYSKEDLKQMIVDFDKCYDKQRLCSDICQAAKDDKIDTTPDVCGGNKIRVLRGSVFPGCEAEYVECNEKVLEKLSFTEKFKALWDLRNTSSSDWGVDEGVFGSFRGSLGMAPCQWLWEISDSACRMAGEKYCEEVSMSLIPATSGVLAVGFVLCTAVVCKICHNVRLALSGVWRSEN